MSKALTKLGLSRLLNRLFNGDKSSPEKPHEFTAFVLHGLLGSGRNWISFSRSLASYLSPAQWRMVLVDLRSHGKSAEIEGLLPPHNLENAAKDLANLVKSEGWDWPDVVIGHSMGGKVALQFAQSCANGYYGDNVSLPKQLWVLDSVPGKVTQENSDGEVEKVLQTLQSLPSTIPSRKWLVDHMLKLGFSKSLSEWIGSNLKNQKNKWNRDVIQQLEHLASKRVSDAEGKVSVHVLPNAGHWVHVDNPKGLLEIVAPKVASVV
ncbi:hypothetical protein Pfo_028449 [Paulownia fortunei]|nr:hypothetical protein Pfo_028449 [Paulownia fortunei]